MSDPLNRAMGKADEIGSNVIEGVTSIPGRVIGHVDHVVDNGAKTFNQGVDMVTGNVDDAIGNVVHAADRVVGGAIGGVDTVLEHGTDKVADAGHKVFGVPEKAMGKAEKMLP